MKRVTIFLSALLFLVSLTTNTLAAATEDKLLASDGTSGDYFGRSVSIFGNNAIVGADGADPDGDLSGAAYIYELQGNSWVEQQKLTASDGSASNHFGWSVSISDNNAIVGAYYGDGNVADSGAAYIYHFDGSSWVEQQKLIASDGTSADYFGDSVSISGDFAIVGAYADDDNGSGSGSAYIFHFDGSSWVEQQKLIASDGAGSDWFGKSVTISSNYAIVGAPLDDDLGNVSGSAYIFYYDGVNWLEVQKLTASDGAASDRFGASVSISGNYAIIGSTYGEGFVTGSVTDSGAAYIYFFDGSSWVEQQKLFAYNEEYHNLFGNTVSIEGDNAIVGARKFNGTGNGLGAAYIFHYDGSSWLTAEMLSASDGADGDYLGNSVSIFGNKALAGAYFDDDNGALSGSAFVFTDYSTDLVSYDPDNDGYDWDVDCNNSDDSSYPGAVEVCDDGSDTDCDGFTDPYDPDCPPDVDADNDWYGALIDCDDNNDSVNPGAVEDCTDGIDNDCDNLIDAQDPDAVGCNPFPSPTTTTVPVTTTTLPSTTTTLVPGTTTTTTLPPTTTCADIADRGACNDDPNCEWVGSPKSGTCQDIPAAEICDSGIDEDGDGLIDCDDPDCAGVGSCPSLSCTEIPDKDSCISDPNCEWVGSPKNGMCEDAAVCVPDQTPEATCTDGVDNDCDGMTDCADTADCGGDPACQGGSCDTYTDKTSCQSNGCTWSNKDRVCM
jgi:hypothetical protein